VKIGRESILKPIAQTAGRQVGGGALQLTTLLFIAHDLGPANMGTVALVQALQQLLVLLCGLGLGSAKVFFAAQGMLSDKEVRRWEYQVLVVAVLAMCMLSMTAYFWQWPIVVGLLPAHLALAVVGGLAALLFDWRLNGLLAAKQVKRYNLYFLLQAGLYASGILFAWLLGALSVWAVLLLNGGVALFVALLLPALPPMERAEGNDQAGGVSFGQYLIYGLKSQAANVVTFAVYRMNYFALNYTAGPTQLGIFSVAVGICEKLWVVSQAAATVIFPYTAFAKSEAKGVGFAIRSDMVKSTLLFTAVGSVILLMLTGWLSDTVLNGKYPGLALVVLGLVPGVLSWAAVRVISAQFSGFGYPGINLWASIVTCAINVVLLGAMWPVSNAMTVAAIMSVMYFTGLLFIVLVAMRFNRNSQASEPL